MYSRIMGTGSYLPERVVHNTDLERSDTNDEWIRERTGIERRHYAAKGTTVTAGMRHGARIRRGYCPHDTTSCLWTTTRLIFRMREPCAERRAAWGTCVQRRGGAAGFIYSFRLQKSSALAERGVFRGRPRDVTPLPISPTRRQCCSRTARALDFEAEEKRA